jgi:hypothetical protein
MLLMVLLTWGGLGMLSALFVCTLARGGNAEDPAMHRRDR